MFDAFARYVEKSAGSATAFVCAGGVILVWAVSGPLFHWSDTWQLVINTGTTIVTFLMVFVIQRTQSRDTQALHIKVDELIRVSKGARNKFIVSEQMGVAELEALLQDMRKTADQE